MTAQNITPQDLAAALDSVAIKISSRDDRKNLPIFAGYLNDSKKILEWFRQSERIAHSNDWNDALKIQYFGDKLEGPAV